MTAVSASTSTLRTLRRSCARKNPMSSRLAASCAIGPRNVAALTGVAPYGNALTLIARIWLDARRRIGGGALEPCTTTGIAGGTDDGDGPFTACICPLDARRSWPESA